MQVNNWKLHDFGGHLGIQVGYTDPETGLQAWSDKITKRPESVEFDLCAAKSPKAQSQKLIGNTLIDEKGKSYILRKPA